MGYNLAVDLASKDALDGLKLDIGLEQHLLYNHYPPVPVDFVPTCKAAIAACVEEDADRLIELPEGCSWRGFLSSPAREIVSWLHLHPWIENALAEGDDDA